DGGPRAQGPAGHERRRSGGRPPCSVVGGAPMSGRQGNVSEVFVSLQGEGTHAGRRHLFVRFGGCPLRCRYCDTPESLVPVARCRVYGPDGVRELPNPLLVPALDAAVAALAGVAPPLPAIAA